MSWWNRPAPVAEPRAVGVASVPKRCTACGSDGPLHTIVVGPDMTVDVCDETVPCRMRAQAAGIYCVYEGVR